VKDSKTGTGKGSGRRGKEVEQLNQVKKKLQVAVKGLSRVVDPDDWREAAQKLIETDSDVSELFAP
jgi:hypothetical protein